MSCLKIISKSKSLSLYADLFPGSCKAKYYEKNKNKRNKINFDFYMLSLWYGNDEWGPLTDQNKHSIRFLKKYGFIIDKIRNEIGKINVFIDYPMYSRKSDKCAVQQDEIPIGLIDLCSKHGVYINIAIYH